MFNLEVAIISFNRKESVGLNISAYPSKLDNKNALTLLTNIDSIRFRTTIVQY